MLSTYLSKEPFFVHIPKTAGSTIAKLFKDNNKLVGQYDKRIKYPRTNIKCSKWHIPAKYNDSVNFKDYVTFVVVRNPYDRIISEYNYISDKDVQKYNSNINNFILSVLKDDDKKYINDCHFIPQTEYIYDSFNNKVQYILYFESLIDDFNNLSKKERLGFTMKKSNHENKKKRNATIKDLWFETLLEIESYYSKDFEVLNYDKISSNKNSVLV